MKSVTVILDEDDPDLAMKRNLIRLNASTFESRRWANERKIEITYVPLTRAEVAARRRMQEQIRAQRRSVAPTAVRDSPGGSHLDRLLELARTVDRTSERAPLPRRRSRYVEDEEPQEAQRPSQPEGPVVDREAGDFGRKIDV